MAGKQHWKDVGANKSSNRKSIFWYTGKSRSAVLKIRRNSGTVMLLSQLNF